MSTTTPELTPVVVESIRQEMHKNKALAPWADALTAELSALRAQVEALQPKWIPVEETLPARLSHVWIAAPGLGKNMVVLTATYSPLMSLRDGFYWRFYQNEDWAEIPETTHWMPRNAPLAPSDGVTEKGGEA